MQPDYLGTRSPPKTPFISTTYNPNRENSRTSRYAPPDADGRDGNTKKTVSEGMFSRLVS